MGADWRRQLVRPAFTALLLGVGLVALVPSPAGAAHSTYAEGPIAIADIVSPFVANDGGAIQIDDNAAATPSPSVQSVTGVNAPILGLTVKLFGLTHTFPRDIDIQLVGPGGQQVTLMSDAGLDHDVNGVAITFSDSASSLLPESDQIVSGDFRPTNYEGTSNDGFTSPPPNGNTALSVFDGTMPNGDWKLFVRDDAALDAGSISAWELMFQTQTNPYPSSISVTNMPPVISDVNVTLHGLSSTVPDDLDLLLVGPGGQQATLVSDAGGSSPVTNLELTFDDTASGLLPDETTFGGGFYKPTNYGAADVYPDPAPPPSGATPLSVFNGLNPNGQWQLFASDDVHNQSWSSLTGWSLDFTWPDLASPAGLVSIAGGAAVVRSPNVTLTLDATDPAPASGVTLMRFSNDGTAFSAYQPYAASAAWTLSDGDGAKTVYAQFRDADGNESAVVSDTIVLDQTGPAARKVKPAKGARNVKPGAKVKITATEALQAKTITKGTVFLKKKGVHGKVKAKLTYDAVRRTIVVKPKNPLHGTYRVTVRGVRDALGNLWDQKPTKAGAQALKYTFSTD